jgi:hypothetical protein
MAFTYEPISTQTLGSAQASVTFGSIPATYTDLVLVYEAGNSGNVYDGTFVRFNSDTGSNYSWTYILGNGSSAISGRESSVTRTGAGASGASRGMSILNIMNYSNTTTYKTILNRRSVVDASGYTVGAEVGLWRSTATISTVLLFVQSGTNFDAGSTFTLYGIKAA